MRRFRKILVIVDENQTDHDLLDRAARLAVVNNAELTLYDALELTEDDTASSSTNSAIHELNGIQLKRRLDELNALSDDMRSDYPGLALYTDVQQGNLATSAIRAVLSEGYDLVIKSPEGPAGALNALFGSSDQKLMRKCPCPVWIIKKSKSDRFRKILAAVDLNPSVPESEELANRIMAISTSLAAGEECELHVLHAWRLAGEAKLRGRQIHTTQVERILKEMEAAHAVELGRLMEDFPYDKRTVHLIKGSPGEIISNAVEEWGIDLVVIGSVGRSGIPGLLIGNTAERVLNAVDCSVLTLKPEGFETPIRVVSGERPELRSAAGG